MLIQLAMALAAQAAAGPAAPAPPAQPDPGGMVVAGAPGGEPPSRVVVK
jgi:hypothetical protein